MVPSVSRDCEYPCRLKNKEGESETARGFRKSGKYQVDYEFAARWNYQWTEGNNPTPVVTFCLHNCVGKLDGKNLESVVVYVARRVASGRH